MNDENLIPFGQRTESEQREIRHAGGVASGEARREKATFRDAYSALLDMLAPLTDSEVAKLKETWAQDKITNREHIVAASVELASRPTAAGTAERRLIIDTMGEMVTKTQIQMTPAEFLAQERELRNNE